MKEKGHKGKNEYVGEKADDKHRIDIEPVQHSERYTDFGLTKGGNTP